MNAKVTNGEGVFPSIDANLLKNNVKLRMCGFVYNAHEATLGVSSADDEDNDEDFGDIIDLDGFIGEFTKSSKRQHVITDT